MRDEGVIDDAVFAFQLSSSGTTSYLDIGLIDEGAMLDPDNLYW